MGVKIIFSGFIIFGISFFVEKREDLELDFLEILLQKEYVDLEKSKREAEILKQTLSLKSYNDCNLNQVNVDNNFFLKDLNGDGKAEMIFNGGCRPYSMVEIFSKRASDYESIYRRGGAIKRIEEGKNQSVIYIENEPCCCSYFGSIEMLEINKHAEVEIKKAIYHVELLIPHFNDITGIEHVSGQNFILRNTPFDESDEMIKDSCTDDLLLSNFMGEFKAGTKWIQFYELKGWAFGIVQAHFKLEKNKFNQFLKEENEGYIFGWIKTNN